MKLEQFAEHVIQDMEERKRLCPRRFSRDAIEMAYAIRSHLRQARKLLKAGKRRGAEIRVRLADSILEKNREMLAKYDYTPPVL